MVNFGSKLTIFKLNPTCNASKIILYNNMTKKGISNIIILLMQLKR